MFLLAATGCRWNDLLHLAAKDITLKESQLSRDCLVQPPKCFKKIVTSVLMFRSLDLGWDVPSGTSLLCEP